MNPRDIYRIIRRKIRQAKYSWFADLAVSGSKFASYLLARKGLYLCDVRTISDAAEKTFPLLEASPQTRIPPAFSIDLSPSETSIHPPINAYLLTDVIASGKTSVICSKGTLLVPSALKEQREILDIKPGVIGYFNPRYALRYSQTFDEHESAILIGGNGASNWYHYVLEVAPKAFLASLLPSHFKNFPILVPTQVKSAGPFLEILEALLPGRRILDSQHDSVRVQNLITFDEVSHGPFNLDKDLWPLTKNYSHHEDALRLVFEKLRATILPTSSPMPRTRRIFIIRPDTRRNYNQTELFKIAQKYGFESVSPENYSLAEQAQIFAEASHIVGASGAAWTNMIFASEPLKALTWILPQYSQFCSFSMLAHFLGHNLRYITAEPSKKIRSTHDAFSASYRVSPIEFEAALNQLIGET